jgi:hypothetical protein
MHIKAEYTIHIRNAKNMLKRMISQEDKNVCRTESGAGVCGWM